METWGRWQSEGDIPDADQHTVINNSEVSALDAAIMIKMRFRL